MNNLFSVLMTIAALVVVFFGIYAVTDGLAEFLQTTFGLTIQQAVAGAQAFEFAGRATVTIAVVWKLAHAIRNVPSVDWTVIKNLLKERGVLMALLIAAIMATSMENRLYWLLNKVINPETAYRHTDVHAAANADLIALFSFALLFVLFFEKDKPIYKPLAISIAALTIGIIAFWTAVFLV